MIDTTVELKSYLSFKVGEEYFAINAKHIHSIIELIPITKVPQMPGFMLGIINLRDQAIPVIDTRVQFGMVSKPPSSSSCIIILEVDVNDQNILIGNLIDAVSEVIDIENDKILPAPDIGGKYKSEFISGVIHADNRFIMILNIQELFKSDSIASIAINNEDIG